MLLHGYSRFDADYVSWYWNWLVPLLSSGRAGAVDLAPMLGAERSGVLIPVGERDLCLLQNVQIVSVSHTDSLSVGTGVLSRG